MSSNNRSVGIDVDTPPLIFCDFLLLFCMHACMRSTADLVSLFVLQMAASLCWACVAFRIKDSRLVSLLLRQKSFILLTPASSHVNSQAKITSEDCLWEEEEEREEKKESKVLVKEEKNEKREGCATDEKEENREEEEEERSKIEEKKDEEETKAHALASLAGGLAQLGLSQVADEFCLFPILSTVEHFENVRGKRKAFSRYREKDILSESLVLLLSRRRMQISSDSSFTECEGSPS